MYAPRPRGLPHDQVQSHVDELLATYAGASLLFSPIAGFVADKTLTRHGPFLLGLLLLGTNIPVLLVARLLQGITAAFVWTIGMAICLETVGPENLGKTTGSILSFISVGNLSTPLLWSPVPKDGICRCLWYRPGCAGC